METLQVVFLTVFVFFLIVTVHEWGHYFFAKRAGILVREFAIGFGPKLFSIKRGETRYTLRLIPAGGFVRMAGEDPEIVDVKPGQTIAVRVAGDRVTRIYLDRLDERTNVIRGEVEAIDLERRLSVSLNVEGESERYDIHPQAVMIAKGRETQIAPLDRQFGSKTVGQRALAIFAGPAMNFILAFVLFGAYIQMAGIPVEPPDRLLVNEVLEGMPAAKADLRKGDVIDSINGEKIGADYDKMIGMIGESAGKPLVMTVIRDGKPVDIKLTPVLDPESGVGKVGLTAAYPTRQAGFGETIVRSGVLMKDMTVSIFEGFKKLIFGEFKLDDLGGPVRTAEVTSQIAMRGITQLTSWAALLSLYLGIFNLLPIPALDGSRLVFLGLEALRGRPVDPNRESMVHFIGFAMLMLLMLAVTYNDILRLVRGEH
ncbi:RIP metalloprotease RseP [Paenibacillus sp. 32O-W]|jgi:regulator of sigma E protease|uniref:Zinc metalloprotease n=1 Tax=Paenibacillus cisolokensis TaxID=1658519 RepID=A0ABQ4N2P2_9BACL|nr:MULTISPECIES: RIP metalloprotease RseP [Paenibacillus]ALS27585.1 RIP metalloprotease RseP [Paenibacillus sp. 32O-W]GIQ62447.1 zinc metalloprotease [Paenibacillus cisolokensis]